MKNQYVNYYLPLAFALAAPAVWANGYVTPDGGAKQFYIDLNETNITNQVGFTKEFTYSLGGQYTGKAYCDTRIPTSPHFYKSDSALPPSEFGNGYLKLTELTGQPVVNLKGLPADFRPEVPANRGNLDQLVQQATTQNPALKAQELKVGAAEAGVQAARGGHYPTLSLGGSWGKSATWGDSVGAGSLSPDARTNSIGLTLSVPIFSGGATQSGVRQALAQRDIAQDGFEQQKRALDRNTRNAYQTLVQGISEVEARRLAVVSAQSAYDASQVGLEVGTRTVLDVIQNQRILFSAQLDYAQARYNFLQNRLLLSQAVGGLDVAELQDINRLLTQDAGNPSTTTN